MGSFLDKPKTEKTTMTCAGNTLRCGVSEMQGWRVDMEDAHSVVPEFPDVPGHSFFGIYDGHGGSFVSKTVAERIIATIVKTDGFSGYKSTDALIRVLKGAFITLDAEMRAMPTVASGEDHSGSTAVTAMVTPTHIVVANSGDSRVVCSWTSKSDVWGSEDHKPNNEPEQKRIEAAGGSVVNRRVNGDLAVSRAFGDFLYKARSDLPAERQQVTVEPECTAIARSDDLEYLILCCDGIWDVMSNEEVVDFVRTTVLSGEPDLGKVAEALIDTCLAKGSRDNMSALIVAFPAAKQPAPDVVEHYRKMQAEKEAKEARLKAEEAAGSGAGAGEM